MRRMYPISDCAYHHIYSKSIYKFTIFTCDEEYRRFLTLLEYYQFDGLPRYTHFIKQHQVRTLGFNEAFCQQSQNKAKLVQLLSYCLMPTHIHLICQQTYPDGITTFVRRALNAYSRYFNLRHNRRGPLWECRFGNTPIESDEHMQTVLNYLQDNPVKAKLVEKPSQWPYYKTFSHSRCGGGENIPNSCF
jgi:putative transposase